MKISLQSEVSQEMATIKLPYTDSSTSQILSKHLQNVFQKLPARQPIIFVCIGTDRSTGDSLGPLVGSRLAKYNFTDILVYGNLDNPVHAMNLAETLQSIRDEYFDPFIVGIDACLGQIASVGSIQAGQGPVKPGAGVNKDLPPVGNIHITGIVNVGGFMEYFVLQNTRLNLVIQMADVIAKSIYSSLINAKRISVFSGATPVLKRFDQ
jgi:putative sporulation protein YyaC